MSTSFPPEEEALLYQYAHRNMRDSMFASIYSGARPGEIARLTADMVEETPNGQVWTFKEHKTRHKTGSDRRVLVPEMVAELVRKRISRQGRRPDRIVFPSAQGKQWDANSMAAAFTRLCDRIAAKAGVKLHEGACWYTCRHTFAQRMLSGAMPWQNGHACQLQQVAQAMGNSMKVCWAHYGKRQSEVLTWAALKPPA